MLALGANSFLIIETNGIKIISLLNFILSINLNPKNGVYLILIFIQSTLMRHTNNPLHFILNLFFLVTIFISCKSKSDANKLVAKATPPVIVDVLIAEPLPISNIIEANGTVVPAEYVELRPEVNGRLTYLSVPEGRLISKGIIVARINDADLQAQLNKSKVQLDLAQKTEARYKQLLAVNGINQADYDAALNQVNGYKADIAYTQTLIDKTIIKAPFSGVVGLRQISPGAYVTPATLIVTIQQTSEVKIDFTLPEAYSNNIKIGNSIDFSIDGLNKNKAVIVATEPGANVDTRNLKVRAIMQGGKATPGAFVKVYIDAGKEKNAIKIPSNCIIPDDKNNQLVVIKNGLANFVNVQTGVRSANTVEITQGINNGDTIIVTGVLFARPNAPVQVRSVKKLEAFIKQATNN